MLLIYEPFQTLCRKDKTLTVPIVGRLGTYPAVQFVLYSDATGQSV